MQTPVSKPLSALLASALLTLAAPSFAQSANDTHEHTHDHSHSEAHDHGSDDIYNGYFDDDQIENRDLSDWQGDWQSVYPLLRDGTLDPVMADKAAHGDKTAEGYRAYYEVGYETNIDRIVIDGHNVTFHGAGDPVLGQYKDDGFEVLTYKAGNRGVRYIFEKTGGDTQAPQFIQFSDHAIFPTRADHYHLYWGNDRAALLEEVTNWPTYYPSDLSAEEIVGEMLAH